MQLKLSSQERWPCLNCRFLRKKDSFPHFGDFTRNTVGSIKNIINECIAERFNTLKINPTVQDSHGHPQRTYLKTFIFTPVDMFLKLCLSRTHKSGVFRPWGKRHPSVIQDLSGQRKHVSTCNARLYCTRCKLQCVDWLTTTLNSRPPSISCLNAASQYFISHCLNMFYFQSFFLSNSECSCYTPYLFTHDCSSTTPRLLVCFR